MAKINLLEYVSPSISSGEGQILTYQFTHKEEIGLITDLEVKFKLPGGLKTVVPLGFSTAFDDPDRGGFELTQFSRNYDFTDGFLNLSLRYNANDSSFSILFSGDWEFLSGMVHTLTLFVTKEL